MQKWKKTTRQLLLMATLAGAVAVSSAQTTNTVVAQFGTSPDAGNSFTVNLVNTGDTKEIAGFAFKVTYNPAQVALTGVANNTGQPGAALEYTLGPEVVAEDGSASRILLGGTLQNLTNAGNLVELKFDKKPGFTPPLQLDIAPRATEPVVDGLLGPAVENIPHVFDTSQVTR